jgi:hypothetical protein
MSQYDGVFNNPDFIDEWNKIFPHGFKEAIKQLHIWVDKDPNRSKWDVVKRACQVLKDGWASDKMIAEMSRCHNPEYLSPREKMNIAWHDMMNLDRSR